MTIEEKQLLLQDLCARLPYRVKIELTWWVMGEGTYINTTLEPDHIEQLLNDEDGDTEIKPYLRPLSSMTEEEKKELLNHVLGGKGAEFFHVTEDGSIDGNQEAEQYLLKMELHWINFSPKTASCYLEWLYEKQFDVNGLIPLDLAIEVTEENNPYK